MDYGLPPGKCDQLDQRARRLGKLGRRRNISPLLPGWLIHLCVCSWFLGRHSIPLRYSYMANSGRFLGGCSDNCSGHPQDVTWRTDRWRIGGGGGGWELVTGRETSKGNDKDTVAEWLGRAGGTLVWTWWPPPSVFPCLLFMRGDCGGPECAVAPVFPLPLRKWAVLDELHGKVTRLEQGMHFK